MQRFIFAVAALSGPLLLSVMANGAEDPEGFELRHGDRVVLVGSTLIERAQSFDYIETALTARYPRRNILFRNLGWSGDTVFGDARAGFDNAAKGFERLVEHVLALEPTVIVIGYGTNEAFAGPEGLPRFRSGLDRLLDNLAPANARLVFLSPLKHEDLGRPLPDPAAHNRVLAQYCDVIRETAAQRGGVYVDLFNALGAGPEAALPGPLTDNGMHLTGYGYWRAAQTIERLLALPEATWSVALASDGRVQSANGAAIVNVQAADGGLRFRVEDQRLPLSPPPADNVSLMASSLRRRVLSVSELPDGNYTLEIDGQRVASGTADQWSAGLAIETGPDYEQVEELRRAIVKKNELYFHRWRPQNETYLFGFRKHEQGQNAREIPLFDPLVSAAESAVAGQRLPPPREYVLIREP